MTDSAPGLLGFRVGPCDRSRAGAWIVPASGWPQPAAPRPRRPAANAHKTRCRLSITGPRSGVVDSVRVGAHDLAGRDRRERLEDPVLGAGSIHDGPPAERDARPPGLRDRPAFGGILEEP